ncbi:uncharacterized protein A4U43_C04F16380 [Asparagus officinalis]|uniref:Secreted protein n=1 Tax=Asparagus officinalis TaxID=4686 RepID=A0A5P1F411_ASPOF|nr:uncharacterized protein A4U43_C04F16380 [Asparagus officinalis]
MKAPLLLVLLFFVVLALSSAQEPSLAPSPPMVVVLCGVGPVQRTGAQPGSFSAYGERGVGDRSGPAHRSPAWLLLRLWHAPDVPK